jgi:hypothetical protein
LVPVKMESIWMSPEGETDEVAVTSGLLREKCLIQLLVAPSS